VTTIKGERVLLRPLQESDLEESLRVWTPELRHMYGGSLIAAAGPIEARRQGRRAWFERVQRGAEGHCFAIEADGRYIGHVHIDAIDEQSQSGRYRVGIDNPEYWGKGYGTEAGRLMLRYAFETLGLHRVSLRVAAYNARAIRCYEKCGFRHEGIERDSFFVDGKWHDDVLMAILREEWEEINRAPADDSGVRIRACTVADYDQVTALWRAAGLGPRPSDNRDEIAKKLRRDPDLFLVACDGPRIIGSVLGGWDGRRCWVYRMAVHPDYQRQGIGRALMTELEARFRAKGALAINLIFNANNAQARSFYRGLGYEDRENAVVVGKSLALKGVNESEG
jgi:RimJ/RimL family protein N-acetyltransferase/predicted N-acetyltransferase YhbS